jgi:hypothetical protein
LKEGESLRICCILSARGAGAIEDHAIVCMIECIGAAEVLIDSIHLKGATTGKSSRPGNGGCIEVFCTAMAAGTGSRVPYDRLSTWLEIGGSIGALAKVLASHVELFFLFSGIFKEVGANHFGAESLEQGGFRLPERGGNVFYEHPHAGAESFFEGFP